MFYSCSPKEARVSPSDLRNALMKEKGSQWLTNLWNSSQILPLFSILYSHCHRFMMAYLDSDMFVLPSAIPHNLQFLSCIISILSLLFCYILDDIWGWTQGLILATKTLPLGPCHQPFKFWFVFQRLRILPKPVSDCYPPTSTSWVAGITSMPHHAWPQSEPSKARTEPGSFSA
jgi:hypothetical protein